MIVSGRLEQAALEFLAADPVDGLASGRIYKNSVTGKVRIYDLATTTWRDFLHPDSVDVLTNKDIDGGTATDASRITIPKQAKAALDALSRKVGTVVYATDENKVYYDNGSALVPVGTAISGQSQWDEINGAVGPMSLYSPTHFTLPSALTINDMVIFGNLTLNANLNVLGDLFVSGQLIGNGYSVTVDGDATILGGAALSGNDKSHLIRGSLYSGGTWTCTNSSTATTPPVFSVGEDFVCLDVTTGLAKNIVMTGYAASGPLAPRGYALKVGGSLTAGLVDVSGGVIGTPTNGGRAGSLWVGSDAVVLGIQAVGKNGVGTGHGGIGGTVFVGGDLTVSRAAVFDLGGFNEEFAGVSTRGGHGTGSGGIGAVAGALTVQGHVLDLVANVFESGVTISARGGSGSSGGSGANGGAVDLGSAGRVVIYTMGGSGVNTSGSGGVVRVMGSISGEIVTNGGNLAGATTSGFAAGAGGDITVYGDAESCASSGGAGLGTSSGGVGGIVVIEGDSRGVIATGGTVFSGLGTSQGGAGGDVVVRAHCVGSISTAGGSSSGTSTGKGGNGGAVTVYGALVGATLVASAGSGSAASTTGGNGGAVTVTGFCSALVSSTAGSAPAGTPGTAGPITTGGHVVTSIVACTASGNNAPSLTTAINYTAKLSRFNKQVVANISAASLGTKSATAGYIEVVALIPAGFRPSVTTYCYGISNIGGTYQMVVFYVTSAGTLRIYSNASLTNIPLSTANCGPDVPTTVSWTTI